MSKRPYDENDAVPEARNMGEDLHPGNRPAPNDDHLRNNNVPPRRDEDDEDDDYRFSLPYRGNAIIINNEKFTGMPERRGTKKDGDALKRCLEALDFSVTLRENVNAADITKMLNDEARADHSQEDCFLCAIMTHGGKDCIYGADGVGIQIDSVSEPFKSQNSLVGKPKIFIYQACRGERLMSSVEADGEVEADGVGIPPRARVPVEADFLYAYSTLPDYYSWRNSNDGSWYIQEMVKLLRVHAATKSFTDILTKLNRSVIEGYESNTKASHTNRRQQMGVYVSTLTRNIKFTPKC